MSVKDIGRVVVRGLGVASAPLRDMPDFVVIGAKRCGTTSLYRLLEQHPAMMPLFPPSDLLPMKENLKGVHWFDRDAERSEAWYRSHFATSMAKARRSRRTGDHAITGEASPYYMFHPTGVEQAATRLGDPKFVVMLRNPIDRTHSHWKEQVRNGSETLGFAEALVAEPERIRGEAERIIADPGYYSYAHENRSYATQSMYGAILQPWLETFGRDRFHLICSEHFYADPQSSLDSLTDFLDIDRHTFADLRPRNAAPGSDLEPSERAALWERFRDDVDLLESTTATSFGWGP